MTTKLHVTTLPTIPRSWRDPILRANAAKALLAQPHHVLFVINKGQGGYLLARLMPQTPADIITLYVPEAYRRKGHAKALMATLKTAAKVSQCPSLTLEVAASNTAAVALYHVLGLQQVAVRADYYTNPVSNLKEDALVLAVTFP